MLESLEGKILPGIAALSINRENPSFYLVFFCCFHVKQKSKGLCSYSQVETLITLQLVMNKSLGRQFRETVRNEIATIYEGLPVDEPDLIRHLVPEAFTGWRHGRNIIWFRKIASTIFNSSKINLHDHKYCTLLEEKMMRLWQSIFDKIRLVNWNISRK